jgi:putative mRNA 3-end processing factor
MASRHSFADLLSLTKNGLYCPVGDFYVDPWQGVERAVITHAHADHSRFGSRQYHATAGSEPVMRARLGQQINVQTHAFEESFRIGGATVSLHPAGHIFGSAQVRIEAEGVVAVVTGDYKRQPDPTCRPFDVVECDLLVTESTFGLPAFRWPDPDVVFDEINTWWQSNQAVGKASVLCAYALGKSQRLLSGLDPSIGPIYLHGAQKIPTEIYRQSGVELPETCLVGDAPDDIDWSQCLIVAVPSAQGTPWMRRFGKVSVAMASGWMAIRGTRRRRAMDRGFVISDHVDWPDMLRTIHESQATEVWVTHGFSDITARYLSDQGLVAKPLTTQFVGESADTTGEDV